MLFDWVETPPYMTPPSINVCVFKNFMSVCFDNDTHECMLNFMCVCFDNDTHECMLKCDLGFGIVMHELCVDMYSF